MLARLRTHLTYANVMATVAVFLALGGGAVAATSIVGSDGKINGCYTKRGKAKGKLRVVPAGTRCKRGERAIAWNQEGPTGQTGPPGPSTGPAGGALAGSYPNPGLAPPEGWHEVSSFGVCNLAPASWENAAAPWATAAYYRDPYGAVHLKGTVKCAATGQAGYNIFILPAGYRPEAVRFFPSQSADAAGTYPVAVVTSGQVSFNTNVPAGQGKSLDAISFRCGPSGADGCP